MDAAEQRLYVVTKEDSALYVLDLKTKRPISRLPLGAEAYGCLLARDEKTVYITLWGGDKLLAYDRATGRVRAALATGSHPNELIQRRDGRYLFVANANDNSVSVVDALTFKVLETISTSLYPTRLTGSTTNGLALSADQKTLYIANADNNCLAVFDVSRPGHSVAKGFIPTGWYPTCVRVGVVKSWSPTAKACRAWRTRRGRSRCGRTTTAATNRAACTARCSTSAVYLRARSRSSRPPTRPG
ncbi:MAG: beta-propeller fold lactonase family protein [Hymenobacter sp.]